VKATDLEANPEETDTVVELQEIYNKEATVQNIGALENRYGRRRQPKKLTQIYGVSGKRLAAARRRMIHRAISARRKESYRKGTTVEKKRKKGPECSNGIKDRCATRQLRLKNEGTFGRIFRKTVQLEVEKRIVGFSTGLRRSRALR
jgi:hypothetical protein